MSKEDFKTFVRKNPILANHVNSGNMSWQKFYDMYALYGNKNSIWDEYLNNKTITPPTPTTEKVTAETTIKDLLGMIKKIDINSVQKGVDGIQKTISLIQELGSSAKKDTYEPRPIYQHLDD